MADIDRALLLGVLGAVLVFGIRVAIAVVVATLTARALGVGV